MRPTHPSSSRRGVSLAVMTTLLLGSSLSAPQAVPADAGVTSPTLKVWSAQFTTGQRNVPQWTAVSQAKAYDLIAAHVDTYEPWVDDMHTANPELEILVYLNAVFTWRTDLPWAWYAKDANGYRIRSLTFTDTFLMNADNPAWQDWVADTSLALINDSGYDGLFLDVLGPAPIKTTYVTAPPINPDTRLPYTREEWLQATTELAGFVGRALGDRPIQGNGLVNGPEYFAANAPTSILADSGLPMLEGEAFLRGATQSLTDFRSEETWKQDVEMLTHIQGGPRHAAITTKAWAPGSQEQKDQIHEYALASFLMGDDGGSYFQFSSIASDLATPHPWDSVVLGDATTDMAKINGVYQRSFEAGRILVNPTRTTVTLSLGRSYRTLNGTWISNLTLAPNSGKVLRTS